MSALPAPPVAHPPSVMRRGWLLLAGGTRSLVSASRHSLLLLPRHLGAAGMTGGGLLLLAFAIWLTRTLPAVDASTALRSELAAMAVEQRPAVRPAQPESASAFLARLPARADLPAVLAAIAAEANAAGLELPRGSYQYSAPKQGGPARYEVHLPVRGNYTAVRRFVDGALVAVPSATLQSIRLERKEVVDAEVEADLTFIVFVRSAA